VRSSSGGPFLFRSYDQQDVKYDNNILRTPTGNLPTWQVARALLAAPRYFPPLEIASREFSGSSREVHNPSLLVFREVMRRVEKKQPSDKYTLFVSIGSGSYRGPKSNLESPSEMSFLGDTKSTSVSLRGKNYTYHRLNPGNGLSNIKFDEWKKTTRGSVENATIEHISHVTDIYLADPLVRENLRAIAMTLVQKRRARAEKRNLERYHSLNDL
jgi:hypothetical protein